MMQPTEADHLAVIFVEKTLGIELTEWQRRVLLWSLVKHRQKTVAPGMCSHVPAADAYGASISCLGLAGHTGEHWNGEIRWGSY